MPFEFKKLEIPDLIQIKPKVFNDARGFFLESYKYSEFFANGIKYQFVQDNFARSSQGVLRGLHYQLNPKAQGKLIRCVRGAVFDVAVDIRKGSPWYGKWVGIELSETNHLIFWIPPGFAHGYLAITPQAEVLYKTTNEYDPKLERGIIWNDPILAIRWGVSSPTISPKDSILPSLKDAENNFVYQND